MKKFFNKLFKKRKKGFTLIEILVVIVILGILAGIAVPTYNKLIRKSRVSDGLHGLDMLAGAQEKYFIEHGTYSQNLVALNPPFKEYREQIPGAPFTNIITTNFTYDKPAQQHCILAISNIENSSYTLVKNYKSKEKVGCWGADCDDISDYVGIINDYGAVCPNEVQCDLTEEKCQKYNQHFWASDCDCHKCLLKELETCKAQGGTFNEDTCECQITGGSCEPGTYTLGNYIQGSSCKYGSDQLCGILVEKLICNKNGEWVSGEPICRPKADYCTSINMILNPNTCECDSSDSCSEENYEEYIWAGNCNYADRGSGKGNVSQGGVNEINYVCGIIRKLRKCVNKKWIIVSEECMPKNEYCSINHMLINEKTCECICNLLDKPQCPSKGKVICDPCPLDPNVNTVIAEIINNTKSSHCYHCGWRDAIGGQAECNKDTGEWECPGFGDCNEVTGDIPSSQDCDGIGENGNNCGSKNLSKIRCWQEVEGGKPELVPLYSDICTLKDDNACFSGQEPIPCSTTGYVRICENCQWSDCVPNPNLHCTGAQPTSEVGECGRTSYTCEQDSNGDWNWVGGWVPFGNNECEIGQTTTEGCPEGQQKTCVDCHWSECGNINGGCNENDKLPDEIVACHTKEGVTDPNLYCGTITRTQVCNPQTHQWEWQEGECTNVQEKPEANPIQCPNKCKVHTPIYQCNLDGDQYKWSINEYTDCVLKEGATCDTIGEILGTNTFCNGDCKKVRCPMIYQGETVVANRYHFRCYIQKESTGILDVVYNNNTHNNNPPQSLNHTGVPKKFWDCGVYGTESHNCVKRCKEGQQGSVITSGYSDSDPEQYCESRNASSIKVISNIPTFTKARYCNTAQTGYVWIEKQKDQSVIWCVNGPIPTPIE